MNNRRSIFSKYFVICSAVILLSFVCLGAVLLLVSSRYFIEDKKDILEKNVLSLVSESEDAMKSSPDNWKKQLTDAFQDYSRSSSAEYILTDKNGSIIICSDATGELAKVTISGSLLKNFGQQAQYVYSDFDGSFEKCHIVGEKFSANGPDYYMLAVSAQADQDDYIWNIMEIFGISMIIVIIVVLVIVYFTTMKLTAPIKEMAAASAEIGKGNFSVTIPSYNIREYEELSKAFNDMSANLKSYDTMRNGFIANVSHELRTPMTSIGGFVDGLLDGTIPKEEERHYLKIISSEVHRLTRLVRSMLNLAKIEAGELKPNLESFSALEPIVDSLVTFENRLEEKNIEIRGLDVDRVMLYADSDLIHQVMYNLIENAIKFVNVGGYIEFSFNPVGYMTVISIKNSGDGLSEDELPLVFDRFYKTDKSRGLDATGVGLGLNIVRSIIKLHNGKIMVRSVQGEYTEFVFTIPNTDLH